MHSDKTRHKSIRYRIRGKLKKRKFTDDEIRAFAKEYPEIADNMLLASAYQSEHWTQLVLSRHGSGRRGARSDWLTSYRRPGHRPERAAFTTCI